jgi:hypothetical protein
MPMRSLSFAAAVHTIRTAAAIAVVLSLAVLATHPITATRVPPGVRRHLGESTAGEHTKTWSGESLAGETTVAPAPAPSAHASGFDQERVFSRHDDWEPFIAVDPNGRYVYQVVTQVNLRTPAQIAFRRSTDGGATWEDQRILFPNHRWQADPQLAVAQTGIVYYVWLEQPWVTYISRSLDHGLTWSAPVSVASRPPVGSDHCWITISPSGRDVYFGFDWNDGFAVASHDFGQSFADPVRIVWGNHERYYFPTGGTVTPDGSVYYAAPAYTQDYTGTTYIDVWRSPDGGATWQTAPVDSSAEMPDCQWARGCYVGFLAPTAGLAADASGLLLVAYNAGTTFHAPQRIWVRTSRDGVRWSERHQISHASPLAGNAFPAVVAGPAAGDFRVVWQGNADGNVNGWNTYYRRTVDGGVTWGPILRLSDVTSGPRYKNAAGYQFPYGDYLGLAVDARGRNYAIWGEGKSYTGPGGCWFTRGK